MVSRGHLWLAAGINGVWAVSVLSAVSGASSHWGATGAAAAYLVAYTLHCCLMLVYLSRANDQRAEQF